MSKERKRLPTHQNRRKSWCVVGRRASLDTPYGYDGYQFGSRHPAGINGLMADGSVDGIAFTINPTTFNNLGHRQDGAVTALD